MDTGRLALGVPKVIGLAGLVPLPVHVTEAGHVTASVTENGLTGTEKWVAVAHHIPMAPGKRQRPSDIL